MPTCYRQREYQNVATDTTVGDRHQNHVLHNPTDFNRSNTTDAGHDTGLLEDNTIVSRSTNTASSNEGRHYKVQARLLISRTLYSYVQTKASKHLKESGFG